MEGIMSNQIFSLIVGISDKIKLKDATDPTAKVKIFDFLKSYIANYQTLPGKEF